MLKLIATLISLMLLAGCERQPAEDKVTHPDSHGGPYLRSEYKVVGRELKEYDDYSGKYVMLTLKHGDMLITAECSMKWTTDKGEDLPSTRLDWDDHTCSDVPMGDVMLERAGWDNLYYFSGEGKYRDETVLAVKKIELKPRAN